ncbi:transcription factor E2F6 [Rhinatrema bivittatum]|uniref:transcription factor E2F6 n=1 Tax=Rhinatrema bivittatum TaxID=194408 RepID=UPI001128F394|nr:transcription factor E2F6 [Rhinatrema bivittatum]
MSVSTVECAANRQRKLEALVRDSLMNMESLLRQKITKRGEEDKHFSALRKSIKVPSSRFDVSLVYLTRKFMELVKNAPGGVLDLNDVARTLGVRKRRVYDITNVLDGIRLVQKISKNLIQWIAPMELCGGIEPVSAARVSGISQVKRKILDQQKLKILEQQKLKDELNDLSAMEQALDELIKECAHQLFELTDDKQNGKLAYVTYQDIQNIEIFHEQIVIAVKAPEETKLEVPAPKEDCIRIHIKSTKGPIDVYLCEMQQNSPDSKTFEDLAATLKSETKMETEASEPLNEDDKEHLSHMQKNQLGCHDSSQKNYTEQHSTEKSESPSSSHEAQEMC